MSSGARPYRTREWSRSQAKSGAAAAKQQEREQAMNERERRYAEEAAQRTAEEQAAKDILAGLHAFVQGRAMLVIDPLNTHATGIRFQMDAPTKAVAHDQ